MDHQQIKRGFLLVAQHQVFADFAAQRPVDGFAVLHGAHRLVVNAGKGNACLLQKTVHGRFVFGPRFLRRALAYGVHPAWPPYLWYRSPALILHARYNCSSSSTRAS